MLDNAAPVTAGSLPLIAPIDEKQGEILRIEATAPPLGVLDVIIRWLGDQAALHRPSRESGGIRW